MFMGAISGYLVDDYCVKAFKDAVEKLKECLGAEKVMDFSAIDSGDFIAKIPPKIKESEGAKFNLIVIYQIAQVGNDFDENEGLVMDKSMETEFLYFEAADCYHLDLNNWPSIEGPSEVADSTNYIEARDIGLLKEKYQELERALKGIVYKIPRERLEELIS